MCTRTAFNSRCHLQKDWLGFRGIGDWLQVDSFESWSNLFHRDQLIKLGPALGSTAVLYGTMHFSASPLGLPAVLVCIPIIFHAVLLGLGWSLEDAADRGWVMHSEVCCSLTAWEADCPSMLDGWHPVRHCTAKLDIVIHAKPHTDFAVLASGRCTYACAGPWCSA